MHRTAKHIPIGRELPKVSWQAFIFALIIYNYPSQFSENIDDPKNIATFYYPKDWKQTFTCCSWLTFRWSALRRYYSMMVGGQETFKDDHKLQLSTKNMSLWKHERTLFASLDIFRKLSNYMWIIGSILSMIHVNFFIVLRTFNMISTFLTNV